MKFVIFGLLGLLVPFFMGQIPAYCLTKHTNNDDHPGPVWMLITGYMISFGFFQLLAVPMILKGQKFSRLSICFLILSLLIAAAGVVCGILTIRKGKGSAGGALSRISDMILGQSTGKKSIRLLTILFWISFALLLLFQLYQSYHLAYSDGDDAFYLPVSVTALEADSMYLSNPYTGNTQVLDTRHCLGPFPIYLAYLARYVGVNATVMAQSMLPVILIVLTYCVYLEIGKALKLSSWKLPLYMVFVSILQIFGNYSIYTGSTFLLTRSRQGKEALANLILPMMFYLLLKLGEKHQKQEKEGNLVYYLLLVFTGLGACLCSTMGSFLFVLPVALTALLFAILYKKPALLVSYALCCIPAGCYALLYLFVR